MESDVKSKELRCSTKTDASRLAGSIYSSYQEDPTEKVTIRVIGAGALNQAIKAVILSNKYFAKRGLHVGVQPSFQDTSDSMTAIELRLLFLKV